MASLQSYVTAAQFGRNQWRSKGYSYSWLVRLLLQLRQSNESICNSGNSSRSTSAGSGEIALTAHTPTSTSVVVSKPAMWSGLRQLLFYPAEVVCGKVGFDFAVTC